mmetsp:Transcript_34119/g.74791  ORF Transcript_34119/g.74791 Transcript_34119/m.74791 type:complete len:85 (-) Transcript_34119:81-335(-)
MHSRDALVLPGETCSKKRSGERIIAPAGTATRSGDSRDYWDEGRRDSGKKEHRREDNSKKAAEGGAASAAVRRNHIFFMLGQIR